MGSPSSHRDRRRRRTPVRCRERAVWNSLPSRRRRARRRCKRLFMTVYILLYRLLFTVCLCVTVCVCTIVHASPICSHFFVCLQFIHLCGNRCCKTSLTAAGNFATHQCFCLCFVCFYVLCLFR